MSLNVITIHLSIWKQSEPFSKTLPGSKDEAESFHQLSPISTTIGFPATIRIGRVNASLWLSLADGSAAIFLLTSMIKNWKVQVVRGGWHFDCVPETLTNRPKQQWKLPQPP